MAEDVDIHVKHLTRVEGHGNITVRIKGGKVEEAKWEIVETPRYFEVMLKGKHYTSAGILTARIVGKLTGVPVLSHLHDSEPVPAAMCKLMQKTSRLSSWTLAVSEDVVEQAVPTRLVDTRLGSDRIHAGGTIEIAAPASGAAAIPARHARP